MQGGFGLGGVPVNSRVQRVINHLRVIGEQVQSWGLPEQCAAITDELNTAP